MASEPPTFGYLADVYLRRAELKRSTRDSYRDALALYWAELRPRPIAEITAPELVALDDAVDWPSRKTRLNALIPLRQVFRYAVARGHRPDNPAQGLSGRRRRDTPPPDPYTPGERDLLLGWLRVHGTPPAWAYFTVAFYTGMRTGELLALRFSDLQGEALMVERAHVRRETTSTKTGVRRKVILLPPALAAIETLPRPAVGDGQLFTNQYGRPFQSGYHLNRSFRRAHAATGIRHRDGPYPWRHTYASIALTAGVRPALVAQQLGHSLTMLLSTYARWLPDDADRDELAKMAK